MRFQKNKIVVILTVIFCILLTACSSSTQPSPGETSTDDISAIDSNKKDYSVKLADEQAKSYKSAVSHIVVREGEKLYRMQYSNCGVTFSNGVLNTEYNGMGIKISGGGEESFYPAFDMNVAEGKPLSFIGAAAFKRKGTEYNDDERYIGYRYLIEIDNASNQPVLKAMRNKDEGIDEDLFSGKYDKLPDFSEFETVSLTAGQFYELSDKTIPVSEWKEATNVILYRYDFSKDIKMEYVPLEVGECYIVYEITNVNGEVYTQWIPYGDDSEEVPNEEGGESIGENSDEDEPVEGESVFALKSEPDITAKWKKGEREQLIFEKSGIEVYLSVEKEWNGESIYAFKIKNNCDYNIRVTGESLLINDNLYENNPIYLTLEPGKFVADEILLTDVLPELNDLKRIRFSMSAEDEERNTIFEDVLVSVDMTDAWPLGTKELDVFKLTKPAMDAIATEQVVFENENVRISLICAGGLYSNDVSFYMTYKVENLTQQEQEVRVEAVTVNNVCIRKFAGVTVPGGCYSYMVYYVSKYSLEPIVSASIETIGILFGIQKRNSWTFSGYDYYWADIELDSHGTAGPISKGNKVWEKDGIRIECFEDENSWDLVVYNGTERDIKVMTILEPTASQSYERNMGYGVVGAGQHSLFSVTNDNSEDDPDGPNQMEAVFRILDLHDEIIMESEKIVLKLD